MTTGAPIYLVSACASGEEFVAAFRRYADKNGLFIPIAEPLVPGKRARFAVTLKDGGVMIDGEAEIVSSARTPSVLHGRVGMTLKFVAPDDASKTVLAELEKARLAMKPAPPSVPPRPADMPAEPRPVPPAPAGRIDANNALAECVAIGEVEVLPAAAAPAAAKPPSKFAVPSIPSPGKTATPPAGAPTASPPAASAPVAAPGASPPTAGTAAAAPAGSPANGSAKPAIAPPRQPTPAGAMPTVGSPRQPTPARPMPVAPPPSPKQPTPAAPLPSVRPAATPPSPVPLVPAPPIVAERPPVLAEVEIADPTDVSDIPTAATPTLDASDGAPDEIPTDAASSPIPEALPERTAAAPPAPRPTTRAAATPPPTPSSSSSSKGTRETRKTVLGVAVVPQGVTVVPAAPAPKMTEPVRSEEALRDTALMAAQEPAGGVVGSPLVDARAKTEPPGPHIEEATPSGDWTITPGEDRPKLIPRTPDAKAKAQDDKPEDDARGLPTGDWTIARVEDSPDGWSEPSKIEKRPANLPGPPVAAVASSKPLESTPKKPEPEDPGASGPKVQIDPTLIEPLQPMPNLDEPSVAAAAAYVAPPTAPGAMPTSLPVAAAAVSMPQMPMQPPMPHLFAPLGMSQVPLATGQELAYPVHAPVSMNDATSVLAGRRRKRTIIIAASAAAAVIAIVLVIVLAGGGSKKTPAAAAGTGSAGAKQDGSGDRASATKPTEPVTPTDNTTTDTTPDTTTDTTPPDDIVVVTPDAGAEPTNAVDVPDPAPAATSCEVSITSTPSGADVVLAGDVIGTTPATVELPCGQPAKLVLRKSGRFLNVSRTVTPTTKGTRIKVALARPTLMVKVSSQPAGAKITAGGKTIGVTPTTVKLTAFETATLTITKDGFAAETRKVTPKQNNQSVHAVLKRKTRGGRR